MGHSKLANNCAATGVWCGGEKKMPREGYLEGLYLENKCGEAASGCEAAAKINRFFNFFLTADYVYLL